MNSDTPLSDAMTALSKNNKLIHTQFRDTLLAAELGMHVTQANSGTEQGDENHTAQEQQVQISSGQDGKGNPVLIVFADPPVFMKNFGEKFLKEFGLAFNATLPAVNLIRTALANNACHGIRLNSATTGVSLVLDRDLLGYMLKESGSN